MWQDRLAWSIECGGDGCFSKKFPLDFTCPLSLPCSAYTLVLGLGPIWWTMRPNRLLGIFLYNESLFLRFLLPTILNIINFRKYIFLSVKFYKAFKFATKSMNVFKKKTIQIHFNKSLSIFWWIPTTFPYGFKKPLSWIQIGMELFLGSPPPHLPKFLL